MQPHRFINRGHKIATMKLFQLVLFVTFFGQLLFALGNDHGLIRRRREFNEVAGGYLKESLDGADLEKRSDSDLDSELFWQRFLENHSIGGPVWSVHPTLPPSLQTPSTSPLQLPTSSPMVDVVVPPTETPALQTTTNPPTLLHTASPTVEAFIPPTESPTLGEVSTPCEIRAFVQCARTVPVFLPTNVSECGSLAPPTETRCRDEQPIQLRWLYTGNPCAESNSTDPRFVCEHSSDNTTESLRIAFISIEDLARTVTFFEGRVRIGEVIAISSESLSQVILIRISSFDPALGGRPGELQVLMQLDVTCEGSSDISLLTHYGPLQLTTFETRSAYQSVFESLILGYGVTNEGKYEALINQFDISTTLFGNTSLVSSPYMELESGNTHTYNFQTLRLNMYQARGQTFHNRIAVGGVGLLSGLECSTDASLTFTVGATPQVHHD